MGGAHIVDQDGFSAEISGWFVHSARKRGFLLCPHAISTCDALTALAVRKRFCWAKLITTTLTAPTHPALPSSALFPPALFLSSPVEDWEREDLVSRVACEMLLVNGREHTVVSIDNRIAFAKTGMTYSSSRMTPPTPSLWPSRSDVQSALANTRFVSPPPSAKPRPHQA